MTRKDNKVKPLSLEERDIISEIERMIARKELPDKYPSFIVESNHPDIFSIRTRLIKNMGFLLIGKDWIKDISQWIGKRKCLEVMAGLGVLSYSLKMEGVNIRSTDDYSWKGDSSIWKKDKLWIDVEVLDALESVERYGREVEIIIMSWPPYNDKIAVKVLRKMREVNPSCLMIYIGEEKGGCTGNDEFFDELKEIEDESFTQTNKNFQSWSITSDRLYLIK